MLFKTNVFLSYNDTDISSVELAWCRGSVMNCHSTALGSIPSGNDIKTELHDLRKGQ